jgi:hypothetical protein
VLLHCLFTSAEHHPVGAALRRFTPSFSLATLNVESGDDAATPRVIFAIPTGGRCHAHIAERARHRRGKRHVGGALRAGPRGNAGQRK